MAAAASNGDGVDPTPVDVEEYDPATAVADVQPGIDTSVLHGMVNTMVVEEPGAQLEATMLRRLEHLLFETPPPLHNTQTAKYVNKKYKAIVLTEGSAQGRQEPSRHRTANGWMYRNLTIRAPPPELRRPGHELYEDVQRVLQFVRPEQAGLLFTLKDVEAVELPEDAQGTVRKVRKVDPGSDWPYVIRCENKDSGEGQVILEAAFLEPNTIRVSFDGPYTLRIEGRRTKLPSDRFPTIVIPYNKDSFNITVVFDNALDMTTKPTPSLEPGLLVIPVALAKPTVAEEVVVETHTQMAFAKCFAPPKGQLKQSTINFKK